MKMRPRIAKGPLTLALSLLSGCAIGPDFVAPLAPDTAGYTPDRLNPTASTDKPESKSQHFIQDLDIPGQWWATFRSHSLNGLIETAMRQNPDLQAAQAGLRNAREMAVAQRGLFYPQATAGYNTTAGKVGEDVALASVFELGLLTASTRRA